MTLRKFGSTDMMVSPLGFGSAEVGFNGTDSAIVTKILNEALDNGLNVVDTAECYADSEQKIGEAISHRRNEYFLFTKCGHRSGLDGEDWAPDMLRRSIDRSLERLRTDCVDLVQLHSCEKELLERGEVIEVLREARAAGKTRYIGYSGDGQAAKYAIECGAFDSLQTSCNIADQECIDLTLPLAKARGMGVIAKRPIANVAWRHESADVAGYGAEYWRRLQDLKYDFDDFLDVALRFTLAQDISVAIVGASKEGRFAQNKSTAEKGPLSADEVALIHAHWKSVAKPDWVGQQ